MLKKQKKEELVTADLKMPENLSKKEKKQIEQEIKVYMEDAEMAVSDLYCVTWKSVTANRVDSKQLKADFPEIYKQVLKQSESRRFTVKRAERA